MLKSIYYTIHRMTYLRRQAGNRGISPITSNPLHEKDLTENKGLSMAIDAALQNALKEETLLHNDKKQSQLKKSKSSRRMPRMTSKKFSSSMKLVGKELKSGAGLINELMEPAKKGVDKVLGPPIHSRSDNSDQFAFDDAEQVEDKKEFSPQTISSNPTRRKGRHAPRTMERQSMTTGNSALDARIAAFQHSAENGSMSIDRSTRSLKSADSKDSFEERIAAKCKANDNTKQQDLTKYPKGAESSNATADNAFEERLRRKMSHQDSTSSTTGQSVSSYESKLQRKLSKSVSNTSSHDHAAQQSLDSYENKLQRKLSKSVSNTSDSYESKLQRKLSGANTSTSSRRIDESSSTHSTAQQSLDSYESKLQRKLSKSVGNASSTARDLGKEELDDFERKVRKKLNSSSNTNVSSEKEELDDFEKKLQRKLSRSVGANSSTARDLGKEVDDYESRLKKKLSTVSNSSSVPPQDQTGNTKAEQSYEKRLRRKLSSGSSERQLESSSKEQAPIKRIDSFEERIQAKCRANDKKVSSKVKDNQEEEEAQQTNRAKSRRSMLDEKIKMSMTKKNSNNTTDQSLAKEDTSIEKSDRVKSRRDIFDEKLKQSATGKKKEKKSKKKSKATESTSKKSTSKDDDEDKERRRRKRRAKAEKVRASLKSVDSDQSKEIHRSSPGRLTIDEDKEGISEILCSYSKHRPRPSMPQEGDAVSLRHISDLTIDDDEPVNSVNDVGWDDLDGALLSAQQMSMKVTSESAQKIQNEVESWDDGFDEEAIAKAQNMSMKVAATDAAKLQAELLADSRSGRQKEQPIVAERKSRGRRGGEKKQTKGKDNDKPQSQLEQAQLILAAKVDKLLAIVSEYGKTKLDVLNALQQTKYDEEKALALLLGL